MSARHRRQLRRALLSATALALLGGCRDTRTADSTPASGDSSLARDIALAQRTAPGRLVFNDAPLGAPANASASRTAPTPRPTPPRTPLPTPAPRRSAPPAPMARAPQPATAPAHAPAPAPGPGPGPVPGPARGSIGAGSQLGMTTNGRICAASALGGDKLTATVTSATVGSNGAVIPAGSTVVLEVASVDRRDPIESSRITFRVRAIDLDGVARPVDGDVATLGSLEPVHSASGNERTKVIGGAVVGAILGRILGGSAKATVIGGAAGAAAGTIAAKRGQTSDACLPDGSALRLTLSRDMPVPTGGGR
jgi:hypothetical protein